MAAMIIVVPLGLSNFTRLHSHKVVIFFLIILFISYASHFAFEYILDFHIRLYFVLFFTTRAMSLATPNDSPEFQKFPEEKQKYTQLIKLEVAYNH